MIGSVYDYYVSTYASKSSGKYDTHKKSELRNVYNNIVKISKSSPLYKVDVSEELQKYAIDLKENARSLHESVDNLRIGDMDTISKSFVSSDDSVLTVNNLLSNEDSASQDIDVLNGGLDFEVKQIATQQVNVGNYLSNNGKTFTQGDHYFEAHIGNNNYEFQFSVNSDDTNRTVLEKLNRLINRSNIGVHSAILGTESRSALEITSDNTGHGFKETLFSISGSTAHPDDIIVEELGIANVSSYPQNAEFLLNGIEKTSANNTFTINNQLEITLNGTSAEGQKTSIFLKDNIDSTLDSVNDLVSTYNQVIDLALSKSESGGDSSRLFSEFKRYANSHKNELESVGITFDEDNRMNFDDSILIQSANEGNVEDSMSKLNAFKKGLIAKSNDITINPMKYVDKVMISYPNPIRTFANPYITSIYSGMMFNGYI